MRKLTVGAVVLTTLMIGGCFTIPVTPDMMRESARSSSFGREETVHVQRPFDAVVSSIAQRAPTCLRGGVRVTTTQGNAATGITTSTRNVYYTPKLVRKGNRAELYIQQMVKGTILVGENKDKIPPEGWYIMVVDIIPAASGGTQLKFYRTFNLDIVATAITQWAKNTGSGCPDLTKISGRVHEGNVA